MDISFIILTWNSAHHIKRCLDSIDAAMGHGELKHEIFVVDNGSTDGTPKIIAARGKLSPQTIKTLFLKKNTGTTYSRNLALRRAEGRVIVIMDSDVELFGGTVEKLIEVLGSDDRIGLAAPRLIYANGTLQKSTDDFPTLWNKARRYFFLKEIEKRESAASGDNVARRVDYAISALWVIRRDVLSEVGLLDERIFYAPEDVDYCLRIWKAGYRVVYVPEVSAIHHAQEISRGFKINKATVHHVLGLLYYFKKHGYIFNRPRFFDARRTVS